MMNMQVGFVYEKVDTSGKNLKPPSSPHKRQMGAGETRLRFALLNSPWCRDCADAVSHKNNAAALRLSRGHGRFS